MNDPALDPDTDGVLGALFAAERGRPDPEAVTCARVLDRAVASVADLPVPPGPRGGGGSGLGVARRVAHPAWVAGAFLAGTAVGVGLHARLAAPVVKTITVVERVETPAAPPPSMQTAPSSPALPSVDRPSVRADPARAEPAGHDVDLAAERAIVEAARTSLSRSRGAAALEALDDHARRFPHGRLAEEREALAVQALVALGRGAEAKERAVRFRRTFPESILLPAVAAAIGSIP